MGDVAVYLLAVEHRAALLDAAATEAHRHASTLATGVGSATGWDGLAAAAFRHADSGLLTRLRSVADELAAVAAALRRHALTVRHEEAVREARARHVLAETERRARRGVATVLDPLGLLS